MALELEIGPGTRPVARVFDELAVGDRCVEEWRLTADGFEQFARLSGDHAPVHVDEAHAQSLGFACRIVPGFYTALRFSRLLGMFLPGSLSVIHSTRFEYPSPVPAVGPGGVGVTYGAVIARRIEALRAVVLDLEATIAGRVVVRGTAQCVMKR